jgi:hypothetical protein
MAVALAGARSPGAGAILSLRRLAPAAAAPVRLGGSGTPGTRRRRGIAMAAAASAPPAPADALPKVTHAPPRAPRRHRQAVYICDRVSSTIEVGAFLAFAFARAVPVERVAVVRFA